MKHINYLSVCVLLLLTIACVQKQNSFPKHETINLDQASVIIDDKQAIISTGRITRIYELTSKGLHTIALKNSDGKNITKYSESDTKCDWEISNLSTAHLKSVSSKISNDENFTGEHIQVIFDFEYPLENMLLRYEIWVYPNASGLRSQIKLKRLTNLDEKLNTNNVLDGFTESLEIPIANNTFIKAFGYYNDTQHRNKKETPILKEQILSQADSIIDWSNGLQLQNNNGGIIFVKESHKCVNQQGIATGAFHILNERIKVSGLGATYEDLKDNAFISCWANWIVTYNGNEEAGITALKEFDRQRYPLDKSKDMYIMANTWGSGGRKDVPGSGGDHQKASREAYVMGELEVQSELGIDVQQIDDGWQGVDYNSWTAVDEITTKDDKYKVYPEGWKNVKNSAEKKSIKLGLWAAWKIPLEDLKRNYNEGGFLYYKLDFAVLDTKPKFDGLITKARDFILYTGNKVRINWDVTENEPRIGYYFGREYGNIYLENRKPYFPENVVYTPYLVLRDAWQVAKYVNLNKFQVTVQNKDMINKNLSDAYLHSHAYCFAITMMGSPIFFQQTQFYEQQAIEELKPLIAIYKKHRDKMYDGIVEPIGDIPNNKNWTGFQNHSDTSGFLTIFREINNQEATKALSLSYLNGKVLEITNLLNNQKKKVRVNEKGEIDFEINTPGDFLFYAYKIITTK
ncbi:hypothetical protein L3X37_01520 [Sabulilitoribacter arenilitoris]|uniref:Alpha-galactosidase n=1 Tax=Wocania arenilitoris TaxID=2044858 RepID=A0AAE3EKN6_9FLAO|nr:hypothetical protein [Wocania arenilitoris]MCF7567043.1 hypothetical protein [Wocania arenilitoris]